MAASTQRLRVTGGSTGNMVRLEGGRFQMGSESPEAFPADGEGPVRHVTLSPFYISKFAVTNAQFAEFARGAAYRTEAERFGWSFVFHKHIPPDAFEAAHIVRHVNEEQTEEQARAAIESALAELESGAKFSEVADRHSDCKGNGGDLGLFAAGVMVPEFEEVIRTLEPGQRSGIFTTPFGFHIAELRAKEPGGPADFEDVRDDIKHGLTAMSEHGALLRAVAGLRARADIRRISREEAGKLAAGSNGAARASGG